VTVLAVDANPWRFQAHPEVWALVAALVMLGVYVTRVIAPKVATAGGVEGAGPAVTGRQKASFAGAVAVLWLAAEWPMHDIGEQYLYSVHMLQHTLLTMVMPPLFLVATPTWLARLILGSGTAGRAVSWLTKPVVAGVAFNLFVALTHWQGLVNQATRNGALHYSIHLVLVVLAIFAWAPVCGPIPERRLALPAQCAYLFTMSIIPTLPAAWLTFAENPVYRAYDVPVRVFNMSIAADQATAGFIMKVGTGFYLWALIAILFFKWAIRHQAADRANRPVTERDVLTWEHVKAELDALDAAERN
jgi:putative membrane protein